MVLKGSMPLSAIHNVAGAMRESCAPHLQRLGEQAAAAALHRHGQQGQARVLTADGVAGDGLRQLPHHPRLCEMSQPSRYRPAPQRQKAPALGDSEAGLTRNGHRPEQVITSCKPNQAPRM